MQVISQIPDAQTEGTVFTIWQTQVSRLQRGACDDQNPDLAGVGGEISLANVIISGHGLGADPPGP